MVVVSLFRLQCLPDEMVSPGVEQAAGGAELPRVDQPVEALHTDAPRDGFLCSAEGGVEGAFEMAEVG